MSTRTTRRGVTLLAIVGALLTAVFAAAPQADAATLYACVKKSNGAMRLVKASTKCRKSERKVSWSTSGPAGKNGANGKNGLNGANGANGANGKEGPAGPFGEVLPSGKSETGAFALEGAGSVVQSGWGFPFALASAPIPHFVADKGAPTAECPGSVSDPKAAAGHLCIYEGTSHGGNVAFKGPFNPENEKFGAASRFGFGIDLDNGTVGSNVWTQGTWAVTAP